MEMLLRKMKRNFVCIYSMCLYVKIYHLFFLRKSAKAVANSFELPRKKVKNKIDTSIKLSLLINIKYTYLYTCMNE